jgi:rare lipoprotein A
MGAHRCWRACGLSLMFLLLAACAANGPRTTSASRASPPSASSVPGSEPRSDRGNPPFYDVLGKRYHVLRTSAGYRQRGVASWYGPDFHGLATSSGEIYDMHAMTAAHTTLPIPTWVEVTNLENGKHVVVKVNDRGPFVDNRLIDLSYAAAIALDMVRNGTARVEVRAVTAPVETVRMAAVTPPPSASFGFSAPVESPASAAPPAEPRMFVQVGAFADRDNAARLVARLRDGGFGNAVIVSGADRGRSLYRVRLGPIGDSTEFDTLRGRLRGAGIDNPQLVVDR